MILISLFWKETMRLRNSGDLKRWKIILFFSKSTDENYHDLNKLQCNINQSEKSIALYFIKLEFPLSKITLSDPINLKVINVFWLFLAHLSWRLKKTFLIKISPLSMVVVIIIVVVNFSHFHLLLQNHLANFNQTWHKAPLGKGDSSFFKWTALPFSKGR